MKSAFHLIRTLLILSCLVSLAFSLEDNDIDTQEPHVNRFKTRRHHNRFRNQQHKRLQHSRGLRVRAPASSAMNYDEGDYDMRNTYPIPITNLTAKVGDTVILNCAINSSYGSNPGVIWMQGKLGNVLTLNTNRISADSRFEIIQSPLEQKDTSIMNKRQNPQPPQQKFHLNYYHLKISGVQAYDENEYTCETTITQSDEQQNLQSLVHLKVTQSPGFIESLTSPSNVAVVENHDVHLECHAVGKPAPNVHWYRINENGYTIDVKHHHTRLTIRNVTRNDLSKYECVAENGILPSVSKKFSLTVNYAPDVTSIRPIIYQNIGEAVLIGCRVNSNPDSTVKWFRKPQNLNKSFRENSEINENTELDYEEINTNVETRYEILKFKQTNQTVTYFKIKSLDSFDLTQFKCEASNTVGVGSAYISIQDLQYFQDMRKQSDLRNNDKTTPSRFDTKDVVYDNDEFYYDLYDEDYKPGAGKDTKLPHQIKTNSFRNPKNRTFYSINKSNRLVKNEDGLQRINGLDNESSAAISIQRSTISIQWVIGFYVFIKFLYPCVV